MRCKTKQEEDSRSAGPERAPPTSGYRRIMVLWRRFLTVGTTAPGAWRNPGEIDDRRG
jgi:hypothetical protein